MKRPAGFTLLSLFLVWVGFAAILLFFISQVLTWDMKALAMAYGVTALATAWGLWRMRSWAYKGFLGWSSVVIMSALDYQFAGGGMFHVPIMVFIPWMVFVFLLLYLPAQFIRKRLIS